MADSKTFAARFNRALDELPRDLRPPPKGAGRQQFVAKMFRVSQKGARKWLEGEALPRLSRIPQIAKKCGVNGEWLLTGQGSMRPLADSEYTNIKEPANSPSYSTTTRRLISQMSEAEATGRLSREDLVAIEGIVLRLLAR